MYATPLANASELSSLRPYSILAPSRQGSESCPSWRLVDSVISTVGSPGPSTTTATLPHQEGHFRRRQASPTAPTTCWKSYPVSHRWFQLLAERLDAVTVLYRAAAMVADADPRKKPLRVDLYRQGPLRHVGHLLKDQGHWHHAPESDPCPPPTLAIASEAWKC